MQGLPIRTSSLLLRHFVPADAQRVMHLNNEETTRRWLPSHAYANIEEAIAAVAHLIACYSSPGDPRLGPYVLGIEHRTSGQLLGHVGFSPLDDDVEVSYAITEHARGRGHGAEALALACRWAAATFSLRRIVAVTAAANRPSRRTLDRTGFVHSGTDPMRFQGTEQTVSRHAWLPDTSPAHKVTAGSAPSCS